MTEYLFGDGSDSFLDSCNYQFVCYNLRQHRESRHNIRNLMMGYNVEVQVHHTAASHIRRQTSFFQVLILSNSINDQ